MTEKTAGIRPAAAASEQVAGATASGPVTDSAFYLAFNANPRGLRFTLPGERLGRRWRLIMNTGVEPAWVRGRRSAAAGDRLIVRGRSVVVLQRIE